MWPAWFQSKLGVYTNVPGLGMSIFSHKTACWHQWRSGRWTSWCCPQTLTCGTCRGPPSPPPPPSASSSSACCGAPWHSWSSALTSPRRTRRWGPLSRCTRRSRWLLPRQPASQLENRHGCHGDLVACLRGLSHRTTWRTEGKRKSLGQISLRHLKMTPECVHPKQSTFEAFIALCEDDVNIIQLQISRSS